MNIPELNPCEISFDLHPKQSLAFTSPANEILYGGAAGGGKSHLMRVVAITLCAQVPMLQVYLFRRIRDDLIKNHMEGPTGFRALLADYVTHKFIQIVEDEIRFNNGSKIYLNHCKDEKDIYKYQGSEIHVLLIDELTHFTDKMYRFLRSRVRKPGLKIPERLQEKLPLILCGSNPGNIGHGWVKQTFVDPVPEMTIHRTSPAEGGMLRQFIPARLTDNPSMANDDPTYEGRLMGLGSEALVRAMLDGDWSVIDGAYFSEWRSDRHVIEPFIVPHHWVRFQAMDYGSARPCAIGWFAIVPDEFAPGPTAVRDRDDLNHIYQGQLPANAIVMYRELYLSQNHNNEGLNLPPEEVGKLIIKAEQQEPRNNHGPKISYRVCDRYPFNTGSGPSIAETLSRAPYSLHFQLGDDKRVGEVGSMVGWAQVRARLRGEDGRPMLYFFKTCVDVIRVMPMMQHNPDKPEDVLKEGMEDHAADMVRYACMSRPYTPPLYQNYQDHPQAQIYGVNSTTIKIRGQNLDLFAGHIDKPIPKHARIR